MLFLGFVPRISSVFLNGVKKSDADAEESQSRFPFYLTCDFFFLSNCEEFTTPPDFSSSVIYTSMWSKSL